MQKSFKSGLDIDGVVLIDPTGAPAASPPLTVLAPGLKSTAIVVLGSVRLFQPEVESLLFGTGRTSTPTGTRNTAVGSDALPSDTSGSNNTAFGSAALRQCSTGAQNTAIGTSAMSGNVSGAQNTAVGSSALNRSSQARDCTAVGANALFHDDTGHNNTSVGAFSLYENISGTDNTAVGAYAAQRNTTGIQNTSIGSFTGDQIGPQLNMSGTHYDGPALSPGSTYSWSGVDVVVDGAAPRSVGFLTATGTHTITAKSGLVVRRFLRTGSTSRTVEVGMHATAQADDTIAIGVNASAPPGTIQLGSNGLKLALGVGNDRAILRSELHAAISSATDFATLKSALMSL